MGTYSGLVLLEWFSSKSSSAGWQPMRFRGKGLARQLARSRTSEFDSAGLMSERSFAGRYSSRKFNTLEGWNNRLLRRIREDEDLQQQPRWNCLMGLGPAPICRAFVAFLPAIHGTYLPPAGSQGLLP
ncbi:MAG: hypothetical protein GX124_07980 [Clostridiales bacterium]|jgi:hypothetical protein|nr:hypothetical protein [Clostridiales bacterium]